MPKAIPVLSQMPDVVELYQEYWNKKPFLVKGLVETEITRHLISAEELAGLSLEEDVRSRIVKKGNTPSDWSCDHGPFEESLFSSLGERNWSLLVQDVEKHHVPTGKLMEPFSISPRWLIDDVMVSYSTPGGGVGPHVDSYHVFLVQGAGRRRWKVGFDVIRDEHYIDGIDLKILKDPFDGQVFEVECGDVIYIPPGIAHEGETLEAGLTYSIGFLGPSLSELFVEFGHYIEEQEKLNWRYDAGLLDHTSAGEEMSDDEVSNFKSALAETIASHHFEKWLKNYFTELKD